MDEKRKCKVCREEKSAASFGVGGDSDMCFACKAIIATHSPSIFSYKGWDLKKDRCFSASLKTYDDPTFIPSPRMTIATAALQGLLASGMTNNSNEFMAKKAVDLADALLNKLSEPKDGV